MKTKSLAEKIAASQHSLQKLSRLSGVAFSTIRSIACGGTKYPRIDTAQKLEKVLR